MRTDILEAFLEGSEMNKEKYDQTIIYILRSTKTMDIIMLHQLQTKLIAIANNINPIVKQNQAYDWQVTRFINLIDYVKKLNKTLTDKKMLPIEVSEAKFESGDNISTSSNGPVNLPYMAEFTGIWNGNTVTVYEGEKEMFNFKTDTECLGVNLSCKIKVYKKNILVKAVMNS